MTPQRSPASFLALLFVLGAGTSLWAAPEEKAPAPLPEVFGKPRPETVEDLRKIETQVEKIIEKVMPCTVCVRFPGSSGSGVFVSKEGHVLTAGHVSGQPGRDVTLVLHDGKTVK